jgi:protease II
LASQQTTRLFQDQNNQFFVDLSELASDTFTRTRSTLASQQTTRLFQDQNNQFFVALSELASDTFTRTHINNFTLDHKQLL